MARRKDQPSELSLGQLIGQRLLLWRRRQRLTQAEIVARCRAVGLDWTDDQVRFLESGRRASIDFDTLIALSVAFRTSLSHWFDTDDWVRITPHLRIRGRDLERWIWGDAGDVGYDDLVAEIDGRRVNVFADSIVADLERQAGETDAYLADQIGRSKAWIAWAAIQKWGKSATARRDEMVGDTTWLSPEQVRARRGHATRLIRRELEEFIDELDERFGRQAQEAREE